MTSAEIERMIENMQNDLSAAEAVKEDAENRIALFETALDNLEIELEETKKAEARSITKTPFGRTGVYYTVAPATNGGSFVVFSHIDYRTNYNDNHFYCCNYFHTMEEAQEIANKFNFLLRLQRLHDELCPGFKPAEGGPNKYNEYITVEYCPQNEDNKWIVSTSYLTNKLNVYFPTENIAYKVCEILNNEENSL